MVDSMVDSRYVIELHGWNNEKLAFFWRAPHPRRLWKSEAYIGHVPSVGYDPISSSRWPPTCQCCPQSCASLVYRWTVEFVIDTISMIHHDTMWGPPNVIWCDVCRFTTNYNPISLVPYFCNNNPTVIVVINAPTELSNGGPMAAPCWDHLQPCHGKWPPFFVGWFTLQLIT